MAAKIPTFDDTSINTQTYFTMNVRVNSESSIVLLIINTLNDNNKKKQSINKKKNKSV